MSYQPSLLDILSATSSLASGCGPTPCVAQGGPTTAPSGQVPALANLSARQAKAEGLLMSGTCGQRGRISLASTRLQLSLESRLQAHPAWSGSTLYTLTWKMRATPSGRPICALRASALHTSGSASGGLPTPSGTSNHGKNHVAGRLDEWGGSSNPFRGTEFGRLHLPSFECWMMGLPAAWQQLTPTVTRSSRRSRKPSLKL